MVKIPDAIDSADAAPMLCAGQFGLFVDVSDSYTLFQVSLSTLPSVETAVALV